MTDHDGPRMLGAHCWRCGFELDDFTHHDGDRDVMPTDGDASVCIRCGALAVFVVTTFGIGLRRPDGDEMQSMLDDDDVVKVLAARLDAAERYGWNERDKR